MLANQGEYGSCMLLDNFALNHQPSESPGQELEKRCVAFSRVSQKTGRVLDTVA